MKRVFLILILSFVLLFIAVTPVVSVVAETPISVKARASCLIDQRTGEFLYGSHENDEYPIASMVKIMTALLTFEEIEKGNLSFEETILISDEAAGMGGSQMFLDRGLSYPVTDLLKGVIVVSANDACVALAERISGSEAAFVDKMNDRAKALGLEHTHFVNATGLPKEGGYSSASDVAVMLRELTGHERYYDFSKIWMEEYKHPDGRTTIFTNTNKFVRFYDECDGGKTGFTSEAKFCLAACATRADTKLISVIIGAEDSKTRFAESKRLLLYGFSNYKTEIILHRGEHAFDAPVKKGALPIVSCAAKEDLSVLRKIGKEESDPNYEIAYFDNRAPITKGDVVGKCTLIVEDKKYETELIALDDVKKANLSDYYSKILGEWGI